MPVGQQESGVTSGVKFVTSTVGNTVGGVTNTVGGVVGALGRGVGETLEGATGSAGRPVARGISDATTSVEDGANRIAGVCHDVDDRYTNRKPEDKNKEIKSQGFMSANRNSDPRGGMGVASGVRKATRSCRSTTSRRGWITCSHTTPQFHVARQGLNVVDACLDVNSCDFAPMTRVAFPLCPLGGQLYANISAPPF
ncbi:hypothetical protein CC78DRAFT_582705 [Lojkania enalia]|uniref:Uncharacterized protein n=1 Tax=Lojkania enalia TaxID=147567 RepID=A0A9P4K4E7_9PLEO|nr:hypothetical protein CC78DRAFT_582705 [Didymosphaeria enalia]